MSDLVIGIDLGTTNSCVSVFKDGTRTVLENESGSRTTPSFIYFSPEGGTVIGKNAKKLAINMPENGIYEMKRLVGRKYDDSKVKKSLKYFPFKVIPDSSNSPVISIDQKTKQLNKSPQELYTILLQELKKQAETKLSEVIEKVVITVPAYFNVTQREVTLQAAKAAGFTVLKLLNEPTAAALAYYYDKKVVDTHRCLVYDLGGGTFDVAVLEKNMNNIEVLCVDGDSQLGGHDFDNCILEHVVEILRKDYDYDNIDPDDKRRLRNICEDAKIDLSELTETVIDIRGMIPQNPKLKILLTRKVFESLINKLAQRTITLLDNTLKKSHISKNSIQEVILSGGSTRIPKIQALISDYFNGKKLSKFVNPDECVAEGAALQAAMLACSPRQKIDTFQMIDVVPLSLGFNSFGSKMVFLIKRNSKIPISQCHSYRNGERNIEDMSFKVYEGERTDVRKNRCLGQFTISNLTPAPPRQLKVITTLSIDHNGILTAKATEKFCDNSKQLKINYTRGCQSEKEIENSLLDAEKNKKADEKFLNFVKYKRYLYDYCESVLYNLENQSLSERYKHVYNFCKETKTTTKSLEVEDKKQVKILIKDCTNLCKSVVERYNFEFMPSEIE